MCPLVYDFGQLTSNTEHNYTKQIVHNHCSQTHTVQEIEAVSCVLGWCQNYMRERKVCDTLINTYSSSHLLRAVSQDECSFVSLRDVERAMIVFRFFTEKFKMKFFTEHIACKAATEVTDVSTPHRPVTKQQYMYLSPYNIISLYSIQQYLFSILM